MSKPIGAVYVPVGLAGCNGIIRFTVVEQDVPLLLPVGIMRTLQASLDLTDDGDKVTFRQFEENPHCALCKADTRPFVPTNLIPMVGSSQKSRNCVRTTMKDAEQISCQSSHTCTRDPNAWIIIHQQETMTQHPHAVADHGRRQHLTATDPRDLIRQSFPLHHLGRRVVNKCTVLFKTMSGIYGRALSMLPVPGRLNGMEHCGRSNSGNASHTTWCTCDALHSSIPCLGNF